MFHGKRVCERKRLKVLQTIENIKEKANELHDKEWKEKVVGKEEDVCTHHQDGKDPNGENHEVRGMEER